MAAGPFPLEGAPVTPGAMKCQAWPGGLIVTFRTRPASASRRRCAALRAGAHARLLLLFTLWTFGTDLSKTRKILGFHLGRFTVLPANGVIHFFAMDADLLGGINPQTHLVAADINHGDLDVVADHDRLIPLTRQHQHGGSFLGRGSTLN